MRYHYIALSQDSRELNGVIEAPDEAQARAKLNELSMSVVSLTAVAEDAALVAHNENKQQGNTASANAEVPVFEFEAFDKNNKKVVGTIAAQDDTNAFKRLFEEYRLSVYYLAPSGLDAQTKKRAREKGVADVQKKYEEQKLQRQAEAKKNPEQSNTSNASANAQNSRNNDGMGGQQAPELSEKDAQEKEELLATVSKTLKKITEFLAQYGAQIKFEERDIITGYTNQLLRIKDSSNIDHIRATCEKMLEHIQRQELFVNEQEKIKESAQLKLETSKLLDELNIGNLSKSIYISDLVEKYKKISALKWLGTLFETIFPPLTPEMRSKKDGLSTLQLHLKTYYKTLFFGSSKALRAEAWEAIKNLRAQKKRLELEYNALVLEQRRVIEAEHHIQSGSDESSWGSLTGFLVSFYLIVYLITFPFTVKHSPLALPQNFFFYQTHFIKGLTLFLFILYSIKAFFSLNEDYNTTVIRVVTYSLASVAFLVTAVNLF